MSTAYAWAAGIVDGEGSIWISRVAPKKSKRTHNPTYQLVFKVEMTHQETITRLASLVDGTVGWRKSKNPERHRSMFSVLLTDVKAVEALRRLLPYLVTKVEQARLALEYRERCSRPPGSQKTPEAVVLLREQYCRRMAVLNKKGPSCRVKTAA